MRHKTIGFLMTVLLLVVVSWKTSARDFSLNGQVSFCFVQDSLSVDSAAVADSVSVAEPQKDALDAPVYYESTDSMVWSNDGNAFLYGDGKVVYDKIELTANVISMNMDSSLVTQMVGLTRWE